MRKNTTRINGDKIPGASGKKTVGLQTTTGVNLKNNKLEDGKFLKPAFRLLLFPKNKDLKEEKVYAQFNYIEWSWRQLAQHFRFVL